MNIDITIQFLHELFIISLLIMLPVLVVSLITGITVSIFQTVTNIQDQALSYVPRIILVGITIIVTSGMAMQQAVNFAHRMFAAALGISQ